MIVSTERYPPIHATRYRGDIDGLRALAVVAVMLFHAGVIGFKGGFVGVDVFFVISGFLIARLILGEIDDGRFTLIHFWERRARRILPALTFVTVVTFVAGWFVLLPGDFVQLGHFLLAQSLFSQNILFWRESGYFDILAETKPLLHTWTLAVEEQFYVLFPISLYLIIRFARFLLVWIIVVVLVASFLLSVWGVQHQPIPTFYLLPTRVWELLIGALLNFTSPIGQKRLKGLADFSSWLGLFLIGLSVFLYDNGTPFPGFAAAIPCAGTALLIWSNGASRTLVGRLLSLPLLVMVGLMSYSLYLWHLPVLVLWRYLVGRSLYPEETVLALGAAVVASVLSWKYVESPIHRGTFLPRRVQVYAAALASLSLLASMGLVTDLTKGFSARLPSTAAQYAAGSEDRNPRRSECPSFTAKKNIIEQLCIVGNKTSSERPTFLLWGDSHAEAMEPAFDYLGSEYGVTGYWIWFSGCPPLLGVHRVDRKDDPCVEFNNETVDFVRAQGIKEVVLIARWSVYAQGYEQGGLNRGPNPFIGDVELTPSTATESKEVFARHLAQTIDVLTDMGVDVWIVREVPVQKIFPPQKLARVVVYQDGDVREIGRPLSEHLEGQAFVSSLLEKLARSNLLLIDPASLLCEPDGLCRVAKDGWSLYRDHNHLSLHGSLKIAPIFTEMFQHFSALDR